jgi:hypothetical protein
MPCDNSEVLRRAARASLDERMDTALARAPSSVYPLRRRHPLTPDPNLDRLAQAADRLLPRDASVAFSSRSIASRGLKINRIRRYHNL